MPSALSTPAVMSLCTMGFLMTALFVRRVVLMGQGGVGKTAMVLRYTTGDFNEKVSVVSSPRGTV